MYIETKNFTSLKGHVCDGNILKTPSGREYVLRNHIKGWFVEGTDGKPISGYLNSALDVEYFVVNGLSSH